MPDPTDVHVTLAEIARIAGVGRAAVSNWRRRHDTFPAPVGGSDTSPQFSLTEVEQWLRHNGKVEGVGSRERLWPQFEALGDRALAGLAIAEVGRRVLAGHVVMPGPAGGDLPEDTRRLVDRAMESGGRADSQETFEFLLARWLDTHVRQISVTPAPLAGLMAVIADVFCRKSGVPESVLDPACGAGGLLLAAARQWATAERTSGLVLAGTERDVALASLAAARLGLVSPEHGGSLGADAGRRGLECTSQGSTCAWATRCALIRTASFAPTWFCAIRLSTSGTGGMKSWRPIPGGPTACHHGLSPSWRGLSMLLRG